MGAMRVFYWNPLAINLCILVILVTAIVGYLGVLLMRANRDNRPTRNLALLLLIYGSGLATVVLQFLAYALVPKNALYALPWVSVAGAVAMMGFVRFAFEFQRPDWRSGWLSPVLNLAYLAAIGLETWVAIERVQLSRQGFVEFREAWLDLPFTVGFLVAYVFYAERYLTAVATDHGRQRCTVIWTALAALLRPGRVLGAKASAARAFIYVSLLPFGHVLLLALRSYGVLDWDIIEPLGAALYLLIFGGFAVAHLNHAPEQSSFQVKLVGSTLVAVLTIVSGITWLIGPVYIDAYENPHRLAPGTSIRFEPGADGAYSVSRTVHQFDRVFDERHEAHAGPVAFPFEFPFFGKQYRQAFVRPAGIIGFESYPIWRDIDQYFGPQAAIFALTADLEPLEDESEGQSGLFVQALPNRVTFSFVRLVSRYGAPGEYTFQVRLFPDGVIEIAFHNLPDQETTDLFRANATPMVMGIVPEWEHRQLRPIHFASELPLMAAPGEGVVEDHRLDFLQYLDRIYRPTAVFLVVASILTLLVFPRFYHSNLYRPLRAMIGGVQDIMRGRLGTSISVEHQDELGYLAQSFNQMARSQQELVTTLEEKVAARTEEAADLAASNARLEERQHLSRELHDAVSQTLFTANLIADRLPSLVAKDIDQAKAEARNLQELNQQALREMRLLLQELRPERLLDGPLGALLQRLAADTSDRTGIAVTLRIEQDCQLPDLVQVAFFRVAQEALHNAVKHADATTIEMVFDGVAGQAFLSITDNGRGFVPGQVKVGRFGLTTMQERLTKIGGTLDIETEPGQGARITAIWYSDHD